MTLHELLDKPVWQMTGEELLFLAQHGKTYDEGEIAVKSSAKEQNLTASLASPKAGRAETDKIHSSVTPVICQQFATEYFISRRFVL